MKKALLICSILLMHFILCAQNKEQDSLNTLTEKIDSVHSREYMAGDNELFFMPTAYTMPKGMKYISDYELVFLNFGFSPGNTTQLGCFMVFPIASGFLNTFTVGAKQKIVSTENVSSALFGTYTFQSSMFTFGGVVSLGPEKFNLHAGVMFFGIPDNKETLSDPVILLGLKLRLSKIFSLIGEYTSFATWAGDDFNGILTVGFRSGGEHFSGEFAFMRPLMKNISDNFISFPFVKIAYYF